MKTTDRAIHAPYPSRPEPFRTGWRCQAQPGRPEVAYDPERVRLAREDELRHHWRRRRQALILRLRFVTPRHLRSAEFAKFRYQWRRHIAWRTGERVARQAHFNGEVRCVEMPGRWWGDVPRMLEELRLPVKASAVRLALSERRAICGLRFYRGDTPPIFRAKREPTVFCVETNQTYLNRSAAARAMLGLPDDAPRDERIHALSIEIRRSCNCPKGRKRAAGKTWRRATPLSKARTPAA